MTALWAGVGLGFLVAAQVGPLWLFCLRSSIRYGFAVGLGIGGGVAFVDALYAAAGAAGATALLAFHPVRLAFGLVGALVLAALGLRTLWTAFRVRLGGEAVDEVASPRRAFATAVVATASNPLTIVSWAAIFSAASTAALVGSPGSAALLVAGIGAGSLAWHVVLSGGGALGGRRAGTGALRAVDAASGLGIAAYGGLLAFRTLRDP